MFPYKVFGDLVFETRTKKFDYTYHMGSGRYEGTLNPNTQNLVHAVFNYVCPHGDVYAYNSNTLAEDATSILQRELRNYLKNQINIDPFFDVKKFSSDYLGFCALSNNQEYTPQNFPSIYTNGFPYVNHIVSLPDASMSRTELFNYLGISTDSKLVTRIGGKTEFNIRDIQLSVSRLSSKYPDIKFVFVK